MSDFIKMVTMDVGYWNVDHCIVSNIWLSMGTCKTPNYLKPSMIHNYSVDSLKKQPVAKNDQASVTIRQWPLDEFLFVITSSPHRRTAPQALYERKLINGSGESVNRVASCVCVFMERFFLTDAL